MEFEKLKAIIAEVLNVSEDEIAMDTTFVDDLGADSIKKRQTDIRRKRREKRARAD